MIDGIDGLLASTSTVSFLALAIISGMCGNTFTFYMSTIFIVCLICYLPYNLGLISKTKRKVFMGDAGSMFIGFSIIAFVLLILSTESIENDYVLRPVTVLFIVALPLMDMISIMFRRIGKGQSPFKADREHIHHIFLRAGFNDRQALVFLFLFSLSVMSVGIICELFKIPEVVMLAVFMSIFFVYNYMIIHAWKIVKFARKFNKDRVYASKR